MSVLRFYNFCTHIESVLSFHAAALYGNLLNRIGEKAGKVAENPQLPLVNIKDKQKTEESFYFSTYF